ncbi:MULTISPECIES: GNAT family N-acetyltransferase [Enterobacteriaceae]|jgi:predicted GNAT family N-acyltransferase|uniref:GNAT family N-acetyltransferase n=1 Tax=Enterobacteriaceae TaxID=543 RepID=UPI00200465F3|nr:GNAT family N-acetyltransferase [Enterobacter bugandensis]MCN6971254.1 GNAT family N-acetyltransferase [Escherichia coli]MCK6879615.1 GNAT family N-acetyltransferase [Enterobacter bugandensis]MCU6172181.1 GNAT family N-acetyltransferase [Enterobacter bugandensis]MDH0089384.1 GNAT family N-acetyltransferase [Enterobacter bugandensis]MDH0112591.1 GNAT family N-acetyltransferase [Enterobacter bugandensis]
MENTENAVSNGLMVCAYQSDITYPGVKHFDCGNAVINSFVRNSLKKSVKDGNCAAKALIDEKTGELIGVCSFTAYSLDKSKLAGTIGGSLPNDVGVVRLIMLGVATKEQKKGYGQDLLCEFFEHVKLIHQALPVKGVYLDADPDAVSFYARLGFVELKEPPNAFGAVPMFLAIQHILAV